MNYLKKRQENLNIPPWGIKKYTINIFKLNHIRNLLKYRNKPHIGYGNVKIDVFLNIVGFRSSAIALVCEMENRKLFLHIA